MKERFVSFMVTEKAAVENKTSCKRRNTAAGLNRNFPIRFNACNRL